MVTTGAVRCAKLQSSRHHHQTSTQLSTGRMPFLLPNQQCQSTEGKINIAICDAIAQCMLSTLYVQSRWIGGHRDGQTSPPR